MSHRGTYKEEPGVAGAEHHPHHPQGPPTHLGHQPRPSSIVHQQQAPPPQHTSQYPAHNLDQHYPQAAPGGGPYYSQQPHQSPYSTPASAPYSAAESAETMATAHMQRPNQYPPISYHTPQSNSPASVASPSGHDGQRMYGPPQPQSMYGYPQQAYPPMPSQGAPAYSAHPQHQQHPSMAGQSNLLMSHAPSHQMQHPSQVLNGSPRTKMEPHVPSISRPSAPLGPPQHPGTPQMNNQNIPGGSGVNPNAAPGPIPATTPLVVRQDNNGVQWIAFEYSRDRVKMEYTIRCDVESVNVDTLTPESKQENCVYPRACCSKDQYRGNRLVYETECNTVGWALAELNPCLRGKRGLIQRAVDSWRNSNQDPRLRSRRVRRMAKINNRKAVSAATHPPHMAAPGPSGMPGGPPPNMGPGGPQASMGKMSANVGGPQLHHHHQSQQEGNGGSGQHQDDGMFSQHI